MAARSPLVHASRPLTSVGVRIDTSPAAFGELEDATPLLVRGDFDAVRRRYDDEGYLLLRGLLAADDVALAADEIVVSLAERRLLDPDYPARERIAARGARVSKLGLEAADRRYPRVRELALGSAMASFYERLFGAPVRAFDYVWLRLMAPGQATAPHCDILYVGRGTHELATSWIPLTPVALEDGPLLLLERSHRIESLRNGYARIDIDRDNNWRRIKFRHGRLFRGGDYSRHPRRVAQEFGRRWLTSTFAPGDVLVISPFLLHAALDNRSQRFQISIDTRYQRASDPVDERWVGEHPIGHARAG
jgi:ectoine hydroxylase-related dioxygenase (phytanoyl-CoA dioxygenase family)